MGVPDLLSGVHSSHSKGGFRMSYVYRDYRSRGKPWCIAYKGLDGRLRREKTEAPTKELAHKLLAKKLVEITEAKVAGVTVELKPITLKEFLKEYTVYLEATKSEGTIRGQKTHIKILEPVFGHLELKQISTGMIQRFLDRRMGDSKKPAPRGRSPSSPATSSRRRGRSSLPRSTASSCACRPSSGKP